MSTETACVSILKDTLQSTAKPVDMLTCSAINFHLAERFFRVPSETLEYKTLHSSNQKLCVFGFRSNFCTFMTFSTLNIIYGLEIVQARGMWFLLLNISSSFARFSLYFMLTFC